MKNCVQVVSGKKDGEPSKKNAHECLSSRE